MKTVGSLPYGQITYEAFVTKVDKMGKKEQCILKMSYADEKDRSMIFHGEVPFWPGVILSPRTLTLQFDSNGKISEGKYFLEGKKGRITTFYKFNYARRN